jgi:CRP/FNR family cyclic AMP-dependent transcriptional regulator
MVKTNLFRNTDDFETFIPGQVIFEQGQNGDKMYVIQEGEVELSFGGQATEVLEMGEMFGEMALIENKSRSGTATAKTACRLVPLDQKQFIYMVHQTPNFALQVMETMADRLRRSNEQRVVPSPS